MPVTIQVAIKSAGEPTRREISADTIKMPEPIMLPITNAIALVRPIPLTNSCVRDVPSDALGGFLVIKPLLLQRSILCAEDGRSEGDIVAHLFWKVPGTPEINPAKS